ncbi:MAG: heparan-alpha-glucosaminide N-acetyltransferase domain-containing protein [Candidatus Hodarchaeota archaeon]
MLNPTTPQNRDVTIDILRGLAVFTMVAANAAAEVLAQPHPLWFRFYGSFAAPLFIIISGMMVNFTTKAKGHRLKHFLTRGIVTVILGAIVDLFIWRIYPFMTIDVLYLIGISLPLAYLFMNCNALSRWIIVICIFISTPFIQKFLGYADYPTEVDLFREQTLAVANQFGIFRHWLVDGWFPIFPWLGFSLLGVNLPYLRWRSESYTAIGRTVVFLISVGLLVLGAIIWTAYPGQLLVREGCSELFYPATIGYVISSIGLILILFYIVDWSSSVIIYNPLKALGRSSLVMYVLHLALVVYIICPIWSEEDFQTFWLVYVLLILLLISTAYALSLSKTRWRDRPYMIRILLGG